MQATKRAFSLIEVLIVVAVIAVLMSMAAPNFANSIRKGKERSLKSDLSLTRAALSAFYSDTGCFPLDIAELCSPIAPGSCQSLAGSKIALSSASFKGPYLPFIPEDSVSNKPLAYSAAAGAVGTVRSSASGADSSGVLFSTY